MSGLAEYFSKEKSKPFKEFAKQVGKGASLKNLGSSSAGNTGSSAKGSLGSRALGRLREIRK